ncbi:MAG: hypothetical protein QM783_03640 [Phycisphaerales bacterium]
MRALASPRTIAPAISAGVRAIARSALRLPIPFTVVKRSKKRRSSAVAKPSRRGSKLVP